MKFLAWIAVWVLFWLGHFVSRPMAWFEWAGVLYPIYNWLMQTSCLIQIRYDLKKPWEDA